MWRFYVCRVASLVRSVTLDGLFGFISPDIDGYEKKVWRTKILLLLEEAESVIGNTRDSTWKYVGSLS